MELCDELARVVGHQLEARLRPDPVRDIKHVLDDVLSDDWLV
jgi:hypothetical protein